MFKLIHATPHMISTLTKPDPNRDIYIPESQKEVDAEQTHTDNQRYMTFTRKLPYARAVLVKKDYCPNCAVLINGRSKNNPRITYSQERWQHTRSGGDGSDVPDEHCEQLRRYPYGPLVDSIKWRYKRCHHKPSRHYKRPRAYDFEDLDDIPNNSDYGMFVERVIIGFPS